MARLERLEGVSGVLGLARPLPLVLLAPLPLVFGTGDSSSSISLMETLFSEESESSMTRAARSRLVGDGEGVTDSYLRFDGEVLPDLVVGEAWCGIDCVSLNDRAHESEE